MRRNRVDNELNLGLGLNYTVHEDERGIQFVEAGFYRDSGSRLAKIAGTGYQYKVGRRWQLGGALLGARPTTTAAPSSRPCRSSLTTWAA